MSTPPNPIAVPLVWNLIASDYAEEVVPRFTRYAQDAVRLAELPLGARMLDVASGPGTLSFVAAPFASSVSALDFSSEMLDVLRARAAAQGVSNIDAREGDGQKLPYDDASFDAAFSMFGLMFFPDRAQAFSELRRVLVRGGRAVVASWQTIHRVPLLEGLIAALQEQLPGLPFGAPRPPLADPEEFADELRAAGFREVRVVATSHGMSFPDLDAFWGHMTRVFAPLVLLRSCQDDATNAAFSQEMRARLDARFGSGPQSYEQPAWLGMGVA